MGHDAAAGGQFRRERNKTEILVDVKAAVHGELAEGSSYSCQAEGYDLFRLAPAHLGIYGIVIQGGEMQGAGGLLPVQCKGRPLPGAPPQRIFFSYL